MVRTVQRFEEEPTKQVLTVVLLVDEHDGVALMKARLRLLEAAITQNKFWSTVTLIVDEDEQVFGKAADIFKVEDPFMSSRYVGLVKEFPDASVFVG